MAKTPHQTTRPEFKSCTLSLVTAYQQGDQKAFTDLYQHIAPHLTRYIAHAFYRNDRTQAEDIVQHAFLMAAEQLKPGASAPFRGECDFYTWISKVARYKAMVLRRHFKTTADYHADPIEASGDFMNDLKLDEYAVSNRLDIAAGWYKLPEDPADIVAREQALEAYQEFFEARAHRPDCYAVGLNYLNQYAVEDMSYNEISEQAGVPVSNAKTCISRARTALKEKLEAHLI